MSVCQCRIIAKKWGNIGMYIKWSELLDLESAGLTKCAKLHEIDLSPESGHRLTRTEDAYLAFAKNALSKICRDKKLNSIDDITCHEILFWTSSLRETYRASSWRFARASVRNLLERLQTQLYKLLESESESISIDVIDEDLRCLEEAIHHIKEFKWNEASINIGKTAAQRSEEMPERSGSAKKKTVDPDFLFQLDLYIRNSGSVWQIRGMKMYWAILYTGLRPSEWEHASIEEFENGIQLTVHKTSNENNSSLIETRKLLIKDPIVCASVHQQVASVNQWKKDENIESVEINFSKKFVTQCSNAIRNAQIQLFGQNKGITPYSFRHQFSSNLIAAGIFEPLMFKLLGVKKTSRESKNAGTGISTPRARKNAVAVAIKPDGFASEIMKPRIELST
jgi:integrase